MSEKKILKPSEEKPWKKFYTPKCNEVFDKSYQQVTLWKLVEGAMLKDGDKYDAFSYFGNHVKRSTVINEVHAWARVMRGMGIKSGDEVVLFAPAFPETVYVLFAANMIGAVVIMPNLFSAKELIQETMCNARNAFVFIGMEDKLDEALASPQFEHVVLLDVGRSMGWPTKPIVKVVKWREHRRILRKNPKYMTVSEAMSRFGNYDGPLEAPAEKGKVTMVFASSGTTLVSQAKLIGMTDEGMIEMFRSTEAFMHNGLPIHPGDVSYCYLPPFAATAFYILMIGPLYFNLTVYLDPRLSLELFTKAVFKYRPQLTLVPGRLWEGFFKNIEDMIAAGKQPDLSFLTVPIMGGEGCTPESLRWIDGLMRKCGCPSALLSGYGMSEVFSVATVENPSYQKKREYNKRVISVGIPFPGVSVGVFDKEGNELPSGERGELCIKSPCMAKCYYGNEQLTREVFRDGWVHSNDLAEIDEDGLVYLYGRMKQNIPDANGEPLYLFDIENEVRQDAAVKAAMTCIVNGDKTNPRIVVHVLLNDDCKETELQVMSRIHDNMQKWLPKGIDIKGYKIHYGMFVSRLAGKLDHMYYEKQTDGYKLPVDGKLKDVVF